MALFSKKRFENLELKKVLIGLLLVDLAFLLLHLQFFTRYSLGMMFNLEADHGYSEWFQYFKEGLICCLLFYVFYRKKSKVFASWAWLVLFLLADDSFRLHERSGDLLAPVIPEALANLFHVSPDSLAEVLFFGIAGCTLIAPVAFFHLRSSHQDRRHSLNLLLMLGVLSFFGVFVDLLHMMVAGWGANSVVVKLFGMIEDGGELLAMSVMLWYASVLWNRTHKPAICVCLENDEGLQIPVELDVNCEDSFSGIQ